MKTWNNHRPLFFLLAVTLLFNLFAFHQNGSLSLFIFVESIYILIIGSKARRVPILTTVISLLLSLPLILSANSFVQSISMLSSLIYLTLITLLQSEDRKYFTAVRQILLAPIDVTLSYINSGFIVLGRLLNYQPPTKVTKRVPVNILVGLAIGLPIFFVIAGLLSSGDPVFGHFTKEVVSNLGKIISPEFWTRAFWHILISIFILSILMPIAYIKITRIPENLLPNHFPFSTQIKIILFLIVLLLSTYLAVDFKYIFINVPAETSLKTFGVATYSEYVKRGFFELSLVTPIIYGVLWLGLLVFRSIKDKTILVLQTVIFAEFTIYLLSMFRRIYLYETFHGWTLSRIYGGSFLLLVLILSAILFARHFGHRSLVLIESLTVTAFIIFIGFFNAENFIATTKPPTVNKNIDYVYLSRLSADGVEGWIKSYTFANNILSTPEFYNVNKIIDKESRRKIALSNMITSNLIVSYHNLVSKYGSPADQKQYTDLLAISKDSPQTILARTRITAGVYPYLDTSEPCPVLNELKPYFYDTSISQPNIDQIDKLLTWNSSEFQAFKKFKSQVNISNLLNNENKALDLYKKIMSQPCSERNFDIDISLESPFL